MLFTFQYGSTYIMFSKVNENALKIYIPVWFYLYSTARWYYRKRYRIYIPVWFYLYAIRAANGDMVT